MWWSLAVRSRLSASGACYLEVSALFVDGNDEPVDVSDELVTLRLPEAVSALLQQLHQHLLNKHRHRRGNKLYPLVCSLISECLTVAHFCWFLCLVLEVKVSRVTLRRWQTWEETDASPPFLFFIEAFLLKRTKKTLLLPTDLLIDS